VAGPVGVLGAWVAVVGRLGGALAAGALWGCGAVLLAGPVSWPGVGSSILLSIVVGAGGAWVPVVRGGLSAVQPGRVRLLCLLPGPWLVLRSA